MRCSVRGCNNNNNKNDPNNKDNVSFFRFPKDTVLLEKWIHFCKRKDQFNPKTGRICSEHFGPDDFERNLQYEMGFVSYRRLIQKPGSFPTIYTTGNKDADSTLGNRKKRIKARKDKKIVDALLQEVEEDPLYISDEDCPNDTQISSCQNCDVLQIQIGEHEAKIQKLEKEVNVLMKNQEKLRTSFAKSRFESKNVERKLSSIFTYGQIRKLKSGSKLTHYVPRSIILYSASAKAYRLFFRARTFCRIRSLNWAIAENLKLQKRKFVKITT